MQELVQICYRVWHRVVRGPGVRAPKSRARVRDYRRVFGDRAQHRQPDVQRIGKSGFEDDRGATGTGADNIETMVTDRNQGVGLCSGRRSGRQKEKKERLHTGRDLTLLNVCLGNGNWTRGRPVKYRVVLALSLSSTQVSAILATKTSIRNRLSA